MFVCAGLGIAVGLGAGCEPPPEPGAGDPGSAAGWADEAGSTAPTALASRPRGITLQMPLEHVLASGGIDTFVGRPPKLPIAFAGPGQPPLPIFLNRYGGRYSPGQDDSRQNTSIVPNRPSTVSGFSGSEAQWQAVVSCITTMWAPYNVTITETEPAGGEYVEAVIGGTPGEVGLPQGVGGVAPIDSFQCNIIPNAIVYAFAEVVGNDPQVTCEIAAQEIAHAFSLDHEYHCPDPMTYLGGCGPKTFRDFDAQCGEYQPRSCNCGRQRQNSVETLIEKLGANNGMPPMPPPNDPNPPTVSITSPMNNQTLTENSTIQVVAEAFDDVQLASTELVWLFSNAVFSCPGTSGGGAVTCQRSGTTSTWSIRVGQGDRTFFVRARDTAGNVTDTPQRTIHLGTAMPPPNDQVRPSAAITSPADGAELPANSTIHIIATATDDMGLASVELVWAFANDTFQCPFNGQGVSCTQNGSTYDWALSVGVGTRQFSVRAVDFAGNQFETPTQSITLSTQPSMPPDTGDIVGEENDRAGDAFPLRCGNAIDLVVTSADEDWFSIDAPEGTQVDVSITAAQGTVIGVELYAPDGTTAIASTNDVLANGGILRGLSVGPTILARITTPATSAGYRLTSMCNREEPPPPPPPGSDDGYEENDDRATATRSACGDVKVELVAMDDDVFAVDVPAGNALTATLDGAGVTVSILDASGQLIAPAGARATTTALPGGDVFVRVEPTTLDSRYGLTLECRAPEAPGEEDPLPARQALAGGCACSTEPGAPATASGLSILALAAALGLRRRRRP